MARLAGKQRGDMRAMEEQMERHNPVSGRGATPSMGMSQFRGGAYGCGDEESDEELVGGGTGGMSRMVGAGTGGRKKKGMSEATQMGLHLGKHLHGLHGAGFFDDFKQGFMSVVGPVAGIAKSVLPMMGPEGLAASGVMGALGLGKARRGRGKLSITHGGATNSDTGAYLGKGREVDDRAMTGLGTGGMVRRGGGFLSDLGIPVVSDLAGMFGMGTGGDGTGAGTGAGTGGRRRRAPAGPSDGRRKRADIVKKVMAEKGMKMIEASKYVKQHNLY